MRRWSRQLLGRGVVRFAKLRRSIPSEKFELVFKNLFEALFVERMDQVDVFSKYMNDQEFRQVVTSWQSSEAYQRIRNP